MSSIKTKKEENFNKWYHEVIEATKFADFSTVQGCIVYSPYCLAIWKQIKCFLDERLCKLGFQEYYFPTLIPLKSFKKQKKHFDDFFREVLAVSSVGASKLEEEYVIRPTSEAIMYGSFAKWVKDKNDLPLLVNQYCSVMRWESFKPNMPLIRGNEFLWQESHSVHATEAEADKYAKDILKIYLELHESFLAMPVVQGFKPKHRMFPGAKYTMALEALMPDLKSVQSATSHSLGQNFSSVFNITFNDDGKEKIAWQACNGITTRVIGALVMLHGDNKGLVIPPKIAPCQCVLININDKKLLESLEKNKLRVYMDDSKKSFDEKTGYWILMGAPIIISQNKNGYKLIRRDTLEKISLNKNSLIKESIRILDSMQNNLYKKAKNFNNRYTSKAGNWKEFEDVANKKRGFIKASWCGDVSCAKEIREKTNKNSVRVVNPIKNDKNCVHCSKKAAYEAIFAPAY